ncbi:MAG: hypothetical protein GY756_03680 [bacterium]|nr:hypothetical protein [bacterium]
MEKNQIAAILPRDNSGHQFVMYSDSCSGKAGTPEEKKFAEINSVLQKLDPQPEFICFPGDEIIGLTPDEEELRSQWKFWLENEMGWLDRKKTPLYNCPGNHTAYDKTSEKIFKEMLNHLPKNGPSGQEGLSYYIQKDNLLLIFVNTLNTDIGGEGHVEIEWLEEVLSNNSDAKYKLVFGHHPVHPVRGMPLPYEHEINHENGVLFWKILKKYNVFAYMCSHILIYDLQVHNGILQILSGGAGRTSRLVHLIQAALDEKGLHYQVLDTENQIKHWLKWPINLPLSENWIPLEKEKNLSPKIEISNQEELSENILVWKISGENSSKYSVQTLLSGWNAGKFLSTFWIGIVGKENRLCILLRPEQDRSPTYWRGPLFEHNKSFEIQIMMHTGMGAGGILWRENDRDKWTSLESASPWGTDRISWPENWSVGFDGSNSSEAPFLGRELNVVYHYKQVKFNKDRLEI